MIRLYVSLLPIKVTFCKSMPNDGIEPPTENYKFPIIPFN